MTTRLESFAMPSQTKSASVHHHSAGLQADSSPLQDERRDCQADLPVVLRAPVKAQYKDTASLSSPQDADTLEKLFPKTCKQKFVELVPSNDPAAWEQHPPMRVGVVLSGGQAPGGHNVISGLFDYIKQCNPNSQLFGFLSGPHGIYTGNYREINAEYMNKFRNQGGFHMICSGRHKIETPEQKKGALQVCKKLDLHGLVVIGGDDSNTNAAILAEYFRQEGSSTLVVGCPKTIDGDLKNEYVETSFGFDTACKTYAELIGNLCTDAATGQNRYHFVRLMGRSASNITLECALQTRPNLTFIGEEVKRDNRSLGSLVDEIVDMVIARQKEGRNFGVVLLPEGLIEFIPEVGTCISEINEILAKGDFDKTKFTKESLHVFESLPVAVRDELLLERDPHGNVQVARIATEKLLITMTETALAKKGVPPGVFRPTAHYFGYEGRCAIPSLFDCNYCYTLGHTAGALLDSGLTAYMAVARGLEKPVSQWTPAGCPLQSMMNIERRHGKDAPVIKKYLVDLDSPTYKLFEKARPLWRRHDLYRNPGPIQFQESVAEITNFSIVPPTEKYMLPKITPEFEEARKNFNFFRLPEALSPLQLERADAEIKVPRILKKPSATAVSGPRCPMQDQQGQKFVSRAFPLQSEAHKSRICNVVDENEHVGSSFSHGSSGSWINNPVGGSGANLPSAPKRDIKIGVVLQGQQVPGSNNVLWGLCDRLGTTGTLYGFKGVTGLLNSDYIKITMEDLKYYRNQGGFELLGRTKATKAKIRTEDGLLRVLKTCTNLALDGLVMIGGQTSLTDAALVTEHFLANNCPTRVIGVPGTQENNLRHSLIEACIGFDSTSKCYSSLVGNLLTDAASATKYWYFVRIMGQVPSHVVLEAAFQTHPNVAIIGEKYLADSRDLQDVVNDIADVVCERSDAGKNFGTVLIPEGLVSQLPNLRDLYCKIEAIVSQTSATDYEAMRQAIVACDEKSQFLAPLSPWHRALLYSLPKFFREQLAQRESVEYSEIDTEQLLAHLVDVELKRRHAEGKFRGSFSPVCHYLGFQGRSTFPSEFDCRLGLSHGYLACIAVESGLTGYVTSIRGLCGLPTSWKMNVIPITAIMKVMPDREMKLYGREIPMVPCAEVSLEGKPYQAFDSACEEWEKHDRFCNPGPIQFHGRASHFHNRTLFEEQHAYLSMLGQLNQLTSYIERVCTFGVDETTLRTTVLSLEGLAKILSHLQQQKQQYA